MEPLLKKRKSNDPLLCDLPHELLIHLTSFLIEEKSFNLPYLSALQLSIKNLLSLCMTCKKFWNFYSNLTLQPQSYTVSFILTNNNRNTSYSLMHNSSYVMKAKLVDHFFIDLMLCNEMFYFFVDSNVIINDGNMKVDMNIFSSNCFIYLQTFIKTITKFSTLYYNKIKMELNRLIQPVNSNTSLLSLDPYRDCKLLLGLLSKSEEYEKKSYHNEIILSNNKAANFKVKVHLQTLPPQILEFQQPSSFEGLEERLTLQTFCYFKAVATDFNAHYEGHFNLYELMNDNLLNPSDSFFLLKEYKIRGGTYPNVLEICLRLLSDSSICFSEDRLIGEQISEFQQSIFQRMKGIMDNLTEDEMNNETFWSEVFPEYVETNLETLLDE
ncbi:hypothetical protein ABK040_007026 [Willaertia magna]